MKIFFGGIIEGSFHNRDIHPQDYRERIKIILKDRLPDIEIFDPLEEHGNSIDYDDDQARETFYKHLEEIKSSTLMLAYLPQASMGTAIEMWQAYRHRIPILTISPMAANWVIRLFAENNFETIESFKMFVDKGDLEKLVSIGRKKTGKIQEKA